MSTDATGTPTSLGIPTLNPDADAPTGVAINEIAAEVDALLKTLGISSLASHDVPVWDSGSSKFIKATGTPSSSTYLTGDGAWTAIPAAAAGAPTGSIIQYGAASAPSTWALCDGSSVLRAGGTYDALFAIIGTTYGTADGTHFNLPDFRGRVPVGYAVSGGHTDVAALANSDGQAAANRRPKHRTSLTDPGHNHSPQARTSGNGTNGATAVQYDGTPNAATAMPSGSAGTGITIGTGVANDALDTPSYLVVNYIIKL